MNNDKITTNTAGKNKDKEYSGMDKPHNRIEKLNKKKH